MKKMLVFLLVTVLICGNLIACKAKRLKVCGTIYPVKYLIDRIGGNRIDSCMLSDNTQIIRAQIIPTYKNEVKEADILFYVGDLEPFMPLYRNELQLQKINLFDVTINSRLYDFKRYTNVKADNNSTIVVESDYYPDAELFAMVDTYGSDPYVWLDAIAYTSMAKTITDYLVKNAPLDKDFFLANFNEIQLELVKLDSEFQVLKEKSSVPKFITLTPSFGNWQKSYGVDIYPLVLSKFGVMPSEAQVEAMTTFIRTNEVRYIVEEDGLYDEQKALIEEIMKKYILRKVKLYNLSFITEEQLANGEDYMSLMRANLETLKQMLD